MGMNRKRGEGRGKDGRGGEKRRFSEA